MANYVTPDKFPITQKFYAFSLLFK